MMAGTARRAWAVPGRAGTWSMAITAGVGVAARNGRGMARLRMVRASRGAGRFVAPGCHIVLLNAPINQPGGDGVSGGQGH